ncbi:hypothetical protein D9615_006392 [Tricholomella constricta]|uniref:HMG box domain-containing protein n=1 Tax=Tricholomella constricta TaxID=117010 RepID=A0A8H5H5T6_9AGAR|nr:hypothetical protein D9615_006392 [Tricholomella constricta]
MLRLQTNPTQLPLNDLVTQGQYLQFHCTTDTDYAFTNVPPTVHSLIPDQGLSPAEFDTPTIYQYSEGSSPSDSLPPSPIYEESPALSSMRATKSAPRLRSGNRVPRPRNAFMIFRSEFWADSKISKSVERDHRHISRIIGHCWNQLPEEEKDVWRRKAEEEKIEHAKRYPGYRFSPNTRTKQVIRRNVKRNGEDELLRCKQVAELLLAGKAGAELDHAVKTIDTSLGREISPPVASKKVLAKSSSNQKEAPVFRSPLLPPAAPQTNTPQYPGQTATSLYTTDYQAEHPSTPYQQNWTLQYPASQQDSELSYTPQYLPPHHHSNTWTSQGYDSVAYSSSAELYHGVHPVDSNYQTFPRSSAFQIEFVNPFGYPAPDPCASSVQENMALSQAPIDPLHWELSRHG